MNVLITGITGMLGSSLARQFLARGHTVYGLSRGKMTRPPLPGEHRFEADITDRQKVREALQAARPAWVIHSAAISDVDFCEETPEEAFRVNREGSRIVAESAEASGAVLCYISTDYVFDGEKDAPYREEDACRPVNVYGTSKLEGEKAARSLCKKYLIIRTSWLFGENHDSFVHHVLAWGRTRKEIRLVTDKWSTPTYTPDLASAVYGLLEKEAPSGIYHVTNGGRGCSWLEYGEKILFLGGINGVTLLPMHLEELNRPARRPRHSILDLGKFTRAAGALRSWEEALRDYLTSVYSNQPKR